MRFIVVIMLMFIHSKLSGQYNFFDPFSVSENVVMTEDFSNKKNTDTIITKYTNGRKLSVEKRKNGKKSAITSWEYEISDSLEIVRQKSINKAQNTLTKNYYNKHGTLIKSELYPADNMDSLISVEKYFEYSSNEVSYYKSSFLGNQEYLTHFRIEKLSKYKSWRYSSLLSSEEIHVIVIEYAKDMKSAIMKLHSVKEYQSMKDYRKKKRTEKQIHPLSKRKNNWDEIKKEKNGIMVNRNIVKIKYVFDVFGNWIETHSVNKKGKTKLTGRRIVHYK